MKTRFKFLAIYVPLHVFSMSHLNARQLNGLTMRARRATRKEATAHPTSQRWEASPSTQSPYEETTATYASPVVLDWIVDVDVQDYQTVSTLELFPSSPLIHQSITLDHQDPRNSQTHTPQQQLTPGFPPREGRPRDAKFPSRLRIFQFRGCGERLCFVPRQESRV